MYFLTMEYVLLCHWLSVSWQWNVFLFCVSWIWNMFDWLRVFLCVSWLWHAFYPAVDWVLSVRTNERWTNQNMTDNKVYDTTVLTHLKRCWDRIYTQCSSVAPRMFSLKRPYDTNPEGKWKRYTSSSQRLEGVCPGNHMTVINEVQSE